MASTKQLREPQRKYRNRENPQVQPLPIVINNISGVRASGSVWPNYRGVFTGYSVLIPHMDDAIALQSMGCFGRGLTPYFNPLVPKVLRRRQYDTRKVWARHSKSPPSTPVNRQQRSPDSSAESVSSEENENPEIIPTQPVAQKRSRQESNEEDSLNFQAQSGVNRKWYANKSLWSNYEPQNKKTRYLDPTSDDDITILSDSDTSITSDKNKSSEFDSVTEKENKNPNKVPDVNKHLEEIGEQVTNKSYDEIEVIRLEPELVDLDEAETKTDQDIEIISPSKSTLVDITSPEENEKQVAADQNEKTDDLNSEEICIISEGSQRSDNVPISETSKNHDTISEEISGKKSNQMLVLGKKFLPINIERDISEQETGKVSEKISKELIELDKVDVPISIEVEIDDVSEQETEKISEKISKELIELDKVDVPIPIEVEIDENVSEQEESEISEKILKELPVPEVTVSIPVVEIAEDVPEQEELEISEKILKELPQLDEVAVVVSEDFSEQQTGKVSEKNSKELIESDEIAESIPMEVDIAEDVSEQEKGKISEELLDSDKIVSIKEEISKDALEQESGEVSEKNLKELRESDKNAIEVEIFENVSKQETRKVSEEKSESSEVVQSMPIELESSKAVPESQKVSEKISIELLELNKVVLPVPIEVEIVKEVSEQKTGEISEKNAKELLKTDEVAESMLMELEISKDVPEQESEKVSDEISNELLESDKAALTVPMELEISKDVPEQKLEKVSEEISKELPNSGKVAHPIPVEEAISKDVPVDESGKISEEISKELPDSDKVTHPILVEESISKDVRVDESGKVSEEISKELPVSDKVAHPIPVEESISKDVPVNESGKISEEIFKEVTDSDKVVHPIPVEEAISVVVPDQELAEKNSKELTESDDVAQPMELEISKEVSEQVPQKVSEKISNELLEADKKILPIPINIETSKDVSEQEQIIADDNKSQNISDPNKNISSVEVLEQQHSEKISETYDLKSEIVFESDNKKESSQSNLKEISKYNFQELSDSEKLDLSGKTTIVNNETEDLENDSEDFHLHYDEVSDEDNVEKTSETPLGNASDSESFHLQYEELSDEDNVEKISEIPLDNETEKNKNSDLEKLDDKNNSSKSNDVEPEILEVITINENLKINSNQNSSYVENNSETGIKSSEDQQTSQLNLSKPTEIEIDEVEILEENNYENRFIEVDADMHITEGLDYEAPEDLEMYETMEDNCVIVISDSDCEGEQQDLIRKWDPQFKTETYKSCDESLILSLEEAFFLMKSLGCLSISISESQLYRFLPLPATNPDDQNFEQTKSVPSDTSDDIIMLEPEDQNQVITLEMDGRENTNLNQSGTRQKNQSPQPGPSGLQNFPSIASAFGLQSQENGEVPLSPEVAWQVFSTTQDTFPSRYVVYHHFRSRNFVVKSGLKYGGDFLLYHEGPSKTHSSYVVRVVRKNHPPKWQSIFTAARIAETTHKEVIVCWVHWTEAGQTLESLPHVKVEEHIVRREKPKGVHVQNYSSSEEEEYSVSDVSD